MTSKNEFYSSLSDKGISDKDYFHNLKNYDAHLIIQELGKFHFKINSIPNRLEKHTSFTLDSKLTFIDSLEF